VSAPEDAATASFKAELIAEGMVEHQADVLIFRQNGREFMAEVRMLDVTPDVGGEAPAKPGVGCSLPANPTCACGHLRSEHAYVIVDGPCGARVDGCQQFALAGES